MAKTLLGIDLGSSQLKLALVRNGRVLRSAEVPMPDRLARDGRVVSVEAAGELIRDTCRKAGIRASSAALLLSGDSILVRNITMPVMTQSQLSYNLPFEFRDYITAELRNYVFDYAMISTPEEIAAAEKAGSGSEGMQLLAAACPAEILDDARRMLRKAGLKLVKASPQVSAYSALIRSHDRGSGKEYCLLDLGQQKIRMYMFRGDCSVVTRELDIGISAVEEAIAEENNVDIHLAHTYLLADHEGCQNSEACRAVYSRIGLELMRAVNFYRFSNPDSTLTDIWSFGGGCRIFPLMQTLESTLDLQFHGADELLPAGNDAKTAAALFGAVGITMD